MKQELTETQRAVFKSLYIERGWVYRFIAIPTSSLFSFFWFINIRELVLISYFYVLLSIVSAIAMLYLVRFSINRSFIAKKIASECAEFYCVTIEEIKECRRGQYITNIYYVTNPINKKRTSIKQQDFYCGTHRTRKKFEVSFGDVAKGTKILIYLPDEDSKAIGFLIPTFAG